MVVVQDVCLHRPAQEIFYRPRSLQSNGQMCTSVHGSIVEGLAVVMMASEQKHQYSHAELGIQGLPPRGARRERGYLVSRYVVRVRIWLNPIRGRQGFFGDQRVLACAPMKGLEARASSALPCFLC